MVAELWFYNVSYRTGRNRTSFPAAELANDGTPLPAAVICRSHAELFHRGCANGQALSYVYYESEPGRRSAAKLLGKDEARRIAANIAKLPTLLPKR